jgi:hypothetical protein
MRIAYLVTAYRDVVHLRRLCAALGTGDPGCLVVVQFDSRSPMLSAARELGVTVLPTRVGIRWGDGTYAESILASMQSLLAAEHEWDWLVLLSGQDYPVRPLTELRTSLETEGVRAFAPAHTHSPGGVGRGAEIAERYGYGYWWPTSTWPDGVRAAAHRLRGPLERVTGGRLRLQPRPRGAAPGIGVRRRATPFSEARPCSMGSDYFAADRGMVAALLALLDREPAVLDYYRRTFVPSESLFPTVFRWIDADAVANRNFHFMHFGGLTNPRQLSPEDLPEIWAHGAIFARKFDDQATWVERRLPLTGAPS